jgi:hypothetical protein
LRGEESHSTALTGIQFSAASSTNASLLSSSYIVGNPEQMVDAANQRTKSSSKGKQTKIADNFPRQAAASHVKICLYIDCSPLT